MQKTILFKLSGLLLIFAMLILFLTACTGKENKRISEGEIEDILFEFRVGVDWEIKNQNIEKLAQEGKVVVPILIRCLKHELPEDLSERIKESAKGKLLASKADGSSFGVQICSEQTLVKIGKPAVPTLIESIDKQSETVGQVIGILGKIGDERAIPVLISVLSNDSYSWWPRAKAAESLQKLNSQKAIINLIDALERVPDDPYNNDKFLNYVADSLAKLSGESFGFTYIPEKDTRGKAGIIPEHYIFTGTTEQKHEAIKRWKEWWQEYSISHSKSF